jgi:hypothetical protein
VIAKVSAHLPHHGRHGKRQEIRTVVDIEAVHRLNQTHPCHLNEIFVRFSAVLEAACDVVSQRQTAFNDQVSPAAVLKRTLVQR